MKHSRFRVMAAAVILALLMLAIPITPALGAIGVIDITSPTTPSGPVGTPITLSCTGFTGSVTYTVYFGGTAVINGSTGTTGNFSVTFAVPSRVRGLYDIVVTTTAPDTSNTETFTITQDVTTSVSTTHVGDTVTVAGSGFDYPADITVRFDGVSKGTTSTTTSGTFSGFSLTVPACPAGAHTIEAEETSNPSYDAAVNVTVAPKITITPTSGAVGATITVNGSGFKASDTVTISFDGVTKTTTTSNTNGTLTAITFTVPEASRGNHTVKGQDTAAHYATATFAVSASVTVNPTSGSSGSTVTVTGTGFAASHAITVTYDGTAITTVPATITTNAAGYFTATFSVPIGEAGTYVVSVSDGTSTITANFESTTSATISQTTTATAPGNVGMSITITGVGFLPEHTITITYESDPATFTTTSLADGSFSYTITIPPSVGGAHTIIVTDGLNSRTFDFFMEENAPPTPDLVLPAAGEKAESEAVFDWETVQDVSPASNPVTYDLQVSSSSIFSTATLLINETELEESTFTIPEAIKLESVGDDEPYYWRVRAVDAASNASDWSAPSTFTVGFSFEFSGWIAYLAVAAAAVIFFFLGLWLGRRSGGGGSEYF